MAINPHFSSGILRKTLVFCVLWCVCGTVSHASSAIGIDSLWVDAQKNVNSQKEADILLTIADIAEESKMYIDELTALRYLGRNYYNRNMNPDSIIVVAKRVSRMGETFKIRKMQEYNVCLADIYSYACYRYMEQGNETEALQLARQFLNAAVENEDVYSHITACEVLGMTYSSFGQHQHALELYQEAYGLCSADNRYPAYAFQLLTDICDEYVHMGMMEELGGTIEQMRPLVATYKDDFARERAECALYCYETSHLAASGQLDKAGECLEKVKSNGTSDSRYVKMKNSTEAKYRFYRGDYAGFVKMMESGQIENSQAMYELYVQSLMKTGRYREAADASQELYEFVKKRSQASYAAALNQIRSQYDFDALTSENEKNAAKVSNLASSLVLGAFSFIVVIAIILTILFYMADKDKKLIMEYQRAQTDFFKNMNHEIRTPLNAISGFAQLLTEPEMRELLSNEELEEYRKAIVDNTTLLTSMFNDIMDATDLSTQKIKVNLSMTSVNEICRSAMNAATQYCPIDVEMHFTSDIDDDVAINTDYDRMVQVLLNYLTNACKHTTRGSIILSANTEEQPGKVTFAVTDTGSGIPEGLEEVIFTPFNKGTSTKQGSGVGLSICRVIAKALKAQAKLDNTYKEGARFVFVHPL